MSVGLYIKGMRCPNSCAVCEWSRSSWMDLGLSCYCQIVKKSGSMDVARKGRMDFCPLVEVPETHGDLIDRQALLEGEGRYLISLCKEGVDVEEILRAKTVIPASEEGKK